MSTKIKHTSGDKVFWLSSKGFKKGIIKSVILTDNIYIHGKKQIKRKEIKYFLWCDNYADVYMGDEVKEDEIFSTYEDMLKYYSTERS